LSNHSKERDQAEARFMKAQKATQDANEIRFWPLGGTKSPEMFSVLSGHYVAAKNKDGRESF
jgi:hypothetical protein